MVLRISLVDAEVLFIVFAWLLFIALRRLRSRSKLPYPPGPKGLPIIGNVLDMPSSHEWLQAAQWRKEFGDIVYLELFGRPLIFVNSYEAAVDLLEKRSATFSTRPSFIMANELQEWNWSLALMPYGDQWRKHRNALRSFFDPPAVTKHLDVQYKATIRMLNSFAQSPQNFHRHIRTSVGAMILMLVYGHEVKDENDSLISLVERAMNVFSIATSPGAFLVNELPMLKHVPEWFPGAGFQRFAKLGRSLSMDMLYKPHEAAKKDVLAGAGRPSMTSELISQNLDEDGNVVDENYIASSTATVYGAGADTTVAALMSVIIAMVLNPQVQRRGHEELDRVLGPDRSPTYEDRSSLPYVEAICLEILRWAKITPLGGPHACSADNVYNGYFIPKGAMIIPNQWLMSNDPSVYANPEIFDPERHLTSDGRPAERSPLKIAFGFGRRVCPGRHLAMQAIFLGVANILTFFDISKAKGPDGEEIDVVFNAKPGIVSQVEPFDCAITPRSAAKLDLLRRTLESLDT